MVPLEHKAVPTSTNYRDTKSGWMLLLYALALVAALSTRHSRGACPREGGKRESTPFRAAIEGGGGWPRQPRMQRYPPGFNMTLPVPAPVSFQQGASRLVGKSADEKLA